MSTDMVSSQQADLWLRKLLTAGFEVNAVLTGPACHKVGGSKQIA